MSEFTPGPWKNLNNEAVISVENGHAVAFPSWHQHERAANANLIAAAPDLLVALEAVIDEDRLIEFVRRCQQYPAEPPLSFFESVFPEVVAAIARATGRDAAVED